MGADLAGWIAKDANFRLLTSATRAQLDMGSTVSKAVKDLKDLATTVGKSYDRDSDWVEYHAETLAEEVEPEPADPNRFDQAADERKAFNLWHDGYHQKAIARIEKLLDGARGLDVLPGDLTFRHADGYSSLRLVLRISGVRSNGPRTFSVRHSVAIVICCVPRCRHHIAL